MSHKHRGVAVIFNHENFTNIEKTKRRGTDKDCERLKEVLDKFGFDVLVHDDFSFKAIEGELQKGLLPLK